MRLSGIDSEKVAAEMTPPATTSVGVENEAATCGPGCNCGTSSRGRSMKAVVSLIVALAVVGIFAYKALKNPSNVAASTDNLAFAVTQTAQLAGSDVSSQSSSLAEQRAATETAIPDDKATTEYGPAQATTDQKIGESLESLSALNTVAANRDAVFIYIPAEKSEPTAGNQTNTVMLAAQKTLERNKITLGLYTLPVTSSDYSVISAQVQVPAVLVASKGRGIAAVSGEVTEAKLLQAFVALSSGGGCGPSGCGPAGCK